MKARWHSLWREWLSPLVYALLLTQSGATGVRVDGASMLPSLRNGEELVVPRAEGWAHRLGVGEYRRGDIVVFKPPREAAQEWQNRYRGLPLPWNYRPYLVKRVVGVPGDQIKVQQGTVYVNGQAVAEPGTMNYWDRFCHDTSSDLANFPALTVPARHYFVMGDNRSPGGSLDSRVFGPVDLRDVAGRAVLSVWPLARKADATPPCDGAAHPEQRVKYSGEVRWNPRWLAGQSH